MQACRRGILWLCVPVQSWNIFEKDISPCRSPGSLYSVSLYLTGFSFCLLSLPLLFYSSLIQTHQHTQLCYPQWVCRPFVPAPACRWCCRDGRVLSSQARTGTFKPSSFCRKTMFMSLWLRSCNKSTCGDSAVWSAAGPQETPIEFMCNLLTFFVMVTGAGWGKMIWRPASKLVLNQNVLFKNVFFFRNLEVD